MKISDILFVIVTTIWKQLKSNDKMKNIPDLDAKLQALFHFTSSILHRLHWSSTTIFKTCEAPSFLVLIKFMGKLPEYKLKNNEQSEVNTKIPDFGNGRHVVTSHGYPI